MGGEKEGSTNREKVRPKERKEETKKKGSMEGKKQNETARKMCHSALLVVCSLRNGTAAIHGENSERCNQTGM
jgi:hypothetical protein